MNKNIFKLVVALLLLAGCTDSFEEINTDPDRPSEVMPTNMLVTFLRDHAETSYDVWGDMNEASTYAGHLAKIQYIDEARYVFRPGVVESNWYNLYTPLNDLKEIREMAVESGSKNMEAVSMVLKSMSLLQATDMWRDVPFTEATRLDEGILLPKYDTQETIYPALLDTLEAASALFDPNGDDLGVGDVLFSGDIDKWEKFSNSLQLRIAMRISEVASAKAKEVVERIAGDPTTYPVMDSNDDSALFWWPGSSPYEEPWYEDYSGRDDHAVSDIFIDYLKSTSDPRISSIAQPAESDGEYRGYIIGAESQPVLNTLSRIGTMYREDNAGYSPFMRYSEVAFVLAEAAAKGWSVNTTAEEAYIDGVKASMADNNIAEADVDAFLAAEGSYDGTTEKIHYQRWVSLFKQGREAWAFYRRTGIPKEHYVAPGSAYVGHNVPPLRYPYPDNESSLNGANSQPYVEQVNDDFWGTKMWYDTREGVQ